MCGIYTTPEYLDLDKDDANTAALNMGSSSVDDINIYADITECAMDVDIDIPT